MAASSTEVGRSKGRKMAKDFTDGEGSLSSNDKEYEANEGSPRKRVKRERVENENEVSLDNGMDFCEQFDSSAGESTEDTDQDYIPNGRSSATRVDTNGNQSYIPTVKMEPVRVGGKETSKKANAAMNFFSRSSRSKRGSGGGRHLSYSPETDKRLLQWVMERDRNGLSVSREAIQTEALDLIRKECPDFKASSGWVEKFLNRHKLSLPNKATMLENGVAKNGTLAMPSSEPEEVSGGNPESSWEPVASTEKKDDDVMAEDEKKSESLVENEPKVVNLMSIPINRRGPSRKRTIRDFKQDEEDEEDLELDEPDCEKLVPENVNPERLKAFNMFVRLFVDENLDRLVPISKQPKEKVLAIIHACLRQFPEFRDRARKRIRTYLKSCRRLKKLKEPLRRTADQINTAPSMSSAQMQEVNNILASACANEADLGDAYQASSTSTQPAATSTTQARAAQQPLTNGRAKSPAETGRQSSTSTNTAQPPATPPPTRTTVSPVQRLTIGAPVGPESLAVARAKAGAEYKLNVTEASAIRQLIASYRESAAFLYRSADELEALLPNSTLVTHKAAVP